MIRRDFFLTMLGIGGGQLILLIAMPFLARVYGPTAFGSYSVIVAVAGIIATIASLRLDLAISSAVDADIAPLTRAGLVLPLLVVPLVAMVLWAVLSPPLTTRLPFQISDIPLIGLIALFQGWVFVGSSLSTRFGSFSILAAAKIAQPSVFAVSALLLFDNLSIAMAAGWIVALMTTFPSLYRISLKLGWHDTGKALRRMWRFPVIAMPMALLDVLALSLPLLVIASTFGDEAAGNYSQVQRLIGAPLILVATAGGQTFLKHAGDRVRAQMPVMPLMLRFITIMVGLAIIVALIVMLIGQPALRLLVGPDWRTDTGFILLALLPVLFRVIASPVSNVLILKHHLAILGMWQIAYFLVTSLTLFGASRLVGFEGTLVALAASEFVMYGAYLFLSVRSARQSEVYTNPQVKC